MPRVIELIRRLLPTGSIPASRVSWTSVPFWPPDLFAVTASLVSVSGCYSRQLFTDHSCKTWAFSDAYLSNIRSVGRTWGSGGSLPANIQSLWTKLLNSGDEQVSDPKATWWESAMLLMAIADEASAGVGFIEISAEQISAFADYIFALHRKDVLKNPQRPRPSGPKLPISLCWMVPPTEACVQPKARTPSVGCTLRSLSHHLALLPPAGEITTSWMFGVRAKEPDTQALNLLVVPFPFRISGGCFRGGDSAFGEDRKSKFFSLNQTWLRHNGRSISPRDLANFLRTLVQEAEREVVCSPVC